VKAPEGYERKWVSSEPSGEDLGEPRRDKNELAEFLSESQRTTQVGACPPVKREERTRDFPRHVKLDRWVHCVANEAHHQVEGWEVARVARRRGSGI